MRLVGERVALRPVRVLGGALDGRVVGEGLDPADHVSVGVSDLCGSHPHRLAVAIGMPEPDRGFACLSVGDRGRERACGVAEGVTARIYVVQDVVEAAVPNH